MDCGASDEAAGSGGEERGSGEGGDLAGLDFEVPADLRGALGGFDFGGIYAVM